VKKKWIVPVFALCLLVISWLITSSFRPSVSSGPGQAIATGPLTIWTDCEGQIEARRLEPIIASFNGNATLVDLAPDGSRVKKGDLLVRFDASQVEENLPALERDYTLTKSELESLEFAQIPLEMKDLDIQVMEAKYNFDAEEDYLRDNLDLLKDELVSQQEVDQQKLKVEQARSKLEQLTMKQELTRQFLHPSQVERAKAQLDSARQQLEQARRQVADRTIYSPVDGMVIYWPVHVAGEFRTVRVGDTLYRNQTFMAIPDMSDLTVACTIPEADLSRVAAGNEAQIAPLAYPELALRGVVESIGTTAQMMPGRQPWQKYFKVIITLQERDERLRTGMSVTAKIRTYENPEALLLPRPAVWWEQGVPHVKVRNGRRSEVRAVQLGPGNQTWFEVREGLAAGDVVLNP
jgi:RND family efflux transporter MFP subunit